jgi:hypothetical protein
VKRCGVCRKSYRGAGRRVVTADGSKIACPSCVGRAFLVVPSDSFAPCTSCGKQASLCLVCADGRAIVEKASVFEEAVLVLKGRIRPTEIRLKHDVRTGLTTNDQHARDEGYVEGVEMAISTLRAGRF